MNTSANQTTSDSRLLDPAFETFLNDLIAAKPFPPTTPEVFKEKVKQDLRPLLMKKINLARVAALPAQHQEKFRQMAEGNATPQQLQAYLEENLDNQDYIIAKALTQFRTSYLGTA